jgi:phospholipid/cholesterol/gamma-HCH transport system substrate-binding protein
VYSNVDKLTESNQIFLNGYAVGRVSDIRIEQSRNRVIVELDINSDIIVTRNTSAILNGELLGGRFIQLSIKPGSPLEPKDTLQSEVAKGLMDFFTENAEPVADNLQTTLKKLNTILDNLAMNSRRLDTVFTGLQKTPGLLNRTLSSANSNINDLSTSFKSVAGNLNTSLNELKPTLANFQTLSDSLKRIELNGTMLKAQQSLAKLNETLSRLNKGDNTMSKLITEDTLYHNLNRTLKSIDSLANHFNEYPRHFLSPLGKSRKKIQKELKDNK